MQKIHSPQRDHKTKVVLVGGCFDILHYGHIYFLKKAKALGNYLVVALESDANTRKLKGHKRPIHTQKQRAEILQSLRLVDKVILLPPFPDYQELTTNVHPAIIGVTEGDPVLKKKEEYAVKVGAKVITIPKIKTASTTQIAKLLSIE